MSFGPSARDREETKNHIRAEVQAFLGDLGLKTAVSTTVLLRPPVVMLPSTSGNSSQRGFSDLCTFSLTLFSNRYGL